jgi:DNA transposition AAA+ family ATPase
VLFCKEHSKSRIFADDCGIGKTYAAKYLARTVKDCFYLDASQCKTKNEFIRALAKAVGVGDRGRIKEIKDDTKYYLRMLPAPVVIIDEAGDMNYAAFLELKEFWNATDSCCGWYLMGADGLREKIERGMRNKKVGFAEMFSRHSERYSTAVPFERNEKIAFYKKLITDVLNVNMTDKANLKSIVARCITADETGHIGGLRRAEGLLILNS